MCSEGCHADRFIILGDFLVEKDCCHCLFSASKPKFGGHGWKKQCHAEKFGSAIHIIVIYPNLENRPTYYL